jgi:hypothetical protein
MSNEFGEDPAIYVWPADHEDGTPFPEDFWDKVGEALEAAGIDWEYV